MTLRRDRFRRHHVSASLPALLAALGLSSPACDTETTASDPPALREAALEEAPSESESDTPAEASETLTPGDTAESTDSAGSATQPTPGPTPGREQSEAEFEAEVQRLMAESEAFRDAMASVRVFDTIPDEFVAAERVESPARMRCNEPPSPAELERQQVPVIEVQGDPARKVGLLARLATLRPADLAPAGDAEPEQPEQP